MVLTTKIRPLKPRVREEYATSFMHIYGTNKVPRVVLWFLWADTHLGQKWNQCATRARHSRTTRHGWPCSCGRPGRCGRPCQVRPHLPCGTPPVQRTSSPAGITWMNEINQENVGFIEWMRLGSLGSMGPLLRPINRRNHHSKAILGVPERRQFITRHGVGPAAPRGPAAPPNRHIGRNWPSTASGVVIRSIQGKRRWITGPAAPVKMGPCAQLTSLAYKRHLTLTGTDTQRWSISFPLFFHLE
jgi:hypothetical protein